MDHICLLNVYLWRRRGCPLKLAVKTIIINKEIFHYPFTISHPDAENLIHTQVIKSLIRYVRYPAMWLGILHLNGEDLVGEDTCGGIEGN